MRAGLGDAAPSTDAGHGVRRRNSKRSGTRPPVRTTERLSGLDHEYLIGAKRLVDRTPNVFAEAEDKILAVGPATPPLLLGLMTLTFEPPTS